MIRIMKLTLACLDIPNSHTITVGDSPVGFRLDLSHLTLTSTLADLPTHDFQVTPQTPGDLVAAQFEQMPHLPGVIIVEEGQVVGAFSRRKFLERVGRPYGVELYLTRPIGTILNSIKPESLQLPDSYPIHAAAQMALSRPAEFVYEPVVVQFADGHLALLDIYILLLAQSHLLNLANCTLETRAQELEALNADKDKFFSIISHDLRGPFQPLLGMSRLLVRLVETSNDIEDIKTMGNTIYRSAHNIYNLLENLLQWALMQRGQIPYEPQQIPLQKIVQRNITLLADKAADKGIELSGEVEEHLRVYGDERLLDTVIRNLVTNALKFTDRGGRVVISAQRMAHFTHISVSDTGVGIPPKTLAKLFALGETRSTLGTAKEQGSGLGLILCKEMVEKNQGQIWVESEVGRGTTFTFTIPVLTAGFDPPSILAQLASLHSTHVSLHQ
jgi:signal transduction histidine kinase